MLNSGKLDKFSTKVIVPPNQICKHQQWWGCISANLNSPTDVNSATNTNGEDMGSGWLDSWQGVGQGKSQSDYGSSALDQGDYCRDYHGDSHWMGLT